MRALVCQAFGSIGELQLGDLAEPKAGSGEVVIEVMAAGVNFLDTLMVQGRYQLKPRTPFAPGAEVSGFVTERGAGVTSLRIGQRVVALVPYGGFAERVVANCKSVFPMPEGLSFIDAAGILIAGGTAYHALHQRANLRQGETLLVLGAAGGVGLAAVEIGKRLGARVIAAASTNEKLALCEGRGADCLVNYVEDDLRERIKAITAGLGVNVVYDPVGGPLAGVALRSLAFLGRYLIIGFASSEIPSMAANLLLLKSSSALGVAWGAFAERFPVETAADVHTLMDWVSQGQLRPAVSRIYPLERSREALDLLSMRQAHGKLVVRLQGTEGEQRA